MSELSTRTSTITEARIKVNTICLKMHHLSQKDRNVTNSVPLKHASETPRKELMISCGASANGEKAWNSRLQAAITSPLSSERST